MESPTGARDAELAARTDAVCRLGSLMLSAGTGSYRVKAAMGRVAAALGIERLDAQVSLNEIVATTRSGDSFRTEVVEVPGVTVNADRIGSLMRLTLRARDGLTPAELHALLDEVQQRRPRYQHLAVIGGAALACSAFAFLNNGRWQECLAAGLGAAVGKAVQIALHRTWLNTLAVVALAAMAAATTYVGVSYVMEALPFAATTVHSSAFTSALLFLIPGFPLLTAALDLARFDFTSGISRLTYALMIIVAAALGAWLVAGIFQLRPLESPALALPVGLLVTLRILASFLGVFGFAVTFNTPLKVAFAASAIGAVSNTARLSAISLGANPQVCAGLATLLVGVLAGWIGQHIYAPRISLSVPAVLIMVPGSSTYRALVSNGQTTMDALANGAASVVIVMWMAAGLAIARMITDPAWTQPRPTWTEMPHTFAQRHLRGEGTDVDAHDGWAPPWTSRGRLSRIRHRGRG